MAKAIPFPDHATLLDAHLARLELRLQAEIALRRREARAFGGGALAVVSDADPDALLAEAESAEESIAARLRVTDREAVPLPFLALLERFGLDRFERDVLLLALAPSLDLRFSQLYALVRDHPGRAELDVDLALAVCARDLATRIRYRRYFAPDAPLLTNALIALDRRRVELGDSFLSLHLRLPQRVLGWLLGDTNLDSALRTFATLVEPEVSFQDVILPPEILESVTSLVERHPEYLRTLEETGLARAISYGRGVVLLFVGPPGTGKTLTAQAVARHLGKRLLLVDPRQIFDLRRPVDDNLQDLFREARLQNAVVFFDECEAVFAHRATGNAAVSLVLSAIEHYDGIVVLATNLPELLDHALDRRVLHRFVFEPPTASQRERIWQRHLPPGIAVADDVDLDDLGKNFEFTGGYIKNAVLVAVNRALGRPERPIRLTQEDLDHAARTQLRARLNEYAERHLTRLKLGDLILPPETAGQVQEILNAARARSIVLHEWGFGDKLTKGRGLSALFDGDSGTGKTHCAEILASELGLTLYRIQVANVVSKYIGETEKNLERVFKEADQQHCLLLFDEADALFSQRTDVKSSNDKYANMEVNVLLELMERYEGIVVLTTNLKKGIDKAFERRITFKVNFPFPEPEYRERIWRHHLPARAPIAEDIDTRVLARSFELSGGSIKNATLRAAYRAASDRRRIEMHDFLESAKTECQASGKLYRIYEPED